MGRRRGGPDHGRGVPRRGRWSRPLAIPPSLLLDRRAYARLDRARRPRPVPPTPSGATDPDAASDADLEPRSRRRLTAAAGARRAGVARADVRSSGAAPGWTAPARSSRASRRSGPILADPEARVWVDVTAPSRRRVDAVVTACSKLHPLIAEDIAERNQRAKFDEVEGAIHVVHVLDRVRGRRSPSSRWTSCWASGSLLTVHEPRLGPVHAAAAPRRRRRRCSSAGPDFLLYAITDGIVDGYFPVLDAIEDEIDELQDDVIREADDVDAGAAVRPQARAHRPPAGDLAGARDLQPAHQPRPRADRARARHLLPRRVRPPDPGHGRAGQRPRARGGHARGLPVDDQQQPVGDHEAADRRDRDPGRDRRRRRDLRHERGGAALAVGEGGGFWAVTAFVVAGAAIDGACSCAGSTGSSRAPPISAVDGLRLGVRVGVGPRCRPRASDARSCVLPGVPFGPSEVWSQSCSVVARQRPVEV